MAIGTPPRWDLTDAARRLAVINEELLRLEETWLRTVARRYGLADKPLTASYTRDMRDRDVAVADDQIKATAAAHAAVIKKRDDGTFGGGDGTVPAPAP